MNKMYKYFIKYFIGYKDAKKLDLYAYCFKKWRYKRDFGKLNKFFNKTWKVF